jgi:hypothetical protein
MNSLPYFSFLLLLSILSCSYLGRHEKITIAKVGEEVLYLSDIQSVLPKDIAQEDSLLLAEDYTNRWIRNKLLIKKAQENLTIAQKDLAKEVEEYRNSLIIYRYQEELMLEKMDTTISDQEISAYFEDNRENFILSSDIVKFIYIKIPMIKKKSELLLNYLDHFSDGILDKIQEFCVENAVKYDLNLDNWTEAKIAFQNLPEKPEDLTGFLTHQSLWKTKDNSCFYFLFIYKYRLAGSYSPIEYVRENIKDMIINKRKVAFLKKVEDDVYAEGVRNNKFTIYENN